MIRFSRGISVADFHKSTANPEANPAEANLAADAANPAAKNPAVKKAAALAYKNGEIPRIAASGKNALAEAIIARAKAHGVPIFQNKELVEALIGLDLDEEIPPESYLAVARILVWLSEVEEKAQLSG